MPPSKPLTFFTIITGVLAVSTASLFIRFAQAEASALAIAGYRMALATLFLMPLVFIRYRLELGRLTWKVGWKVILSGLFLAVHFASWITSLQYTSVASSVVLVTTTPLWVAIFGSLLLNEKISRQVSIGLAVALTGSVLVGLSGELPGWFSGDTGINMAFAGSDTSLTGNLLALVGAWTAAGYMLVGRSVRPQLSLPVYTFLVYGTSAVILLITIAVSGIPMTGFTPKIYIWLLLLAVVPQLIGHTAFNWALRYVPASLVSIALLGEPIGSTILAMIFLRETPVIFEVIGGIFILAGIYLSSRTPANQKA